MLRCPYQRQNACFWHFVASAEGSQEPLFDLWRHPKRGMRGYCPGPATTPLPAPPGVCAPLLPPGDGLLGTFCPPPGPEFPVPGFTGLTFWPFPLGDGIGIGDGLTAPVDPAGLSAPPGPACVLCCGPGESDGLRVPSVSVIPGRVPGLWSLALVVEVGPGLVDAVPEDVSVRWFIPEDSTGSPLWSVSAAVVLPPGLSARLLS